LKASNALAAGLASALETGWQVTARSNQLPPDGDWSIWLLLAGRGFGKTRVLSEMANAWASSGQTKRIAIVAATAADTRDVMVEGESGILATAPPWCVPVYQSRDKRILFHPEGDALRLSCSLGSKGFPTSRPRRS
jgi:phage terminase large subunit-like protein